MPTIICVFNIYHIDILVPDCTVKLVLGTSKQQFVPTNNCTHKTVPTIIHTYKNGD